MSPTFACCCAFLSTNFKHIRYVHVVPKPQAFSYVVFTKVSKVMASLSFRSRREIQQRCSIQNLTICRMKNPLKLRLGKSNFVFIFCSHLIHLNIAYLDLSIAGTKLVALSRVNSIIYTHLFLDSKT